LKKVTEIRKKKTKLLKKQSGGKKILETKIDQLVFEEELDARSKMIIDYLETRLRQICRVNRYVPPLVNFTEDQMSELGFNKDIICESTTFTSSRTDINQGESVSTVQEEINLTELLKEILGGSHK